MSGASGLSRHPAPGNDIFQWRLAVRGPAQQAEMTGKAEKRTSVDHDTAADTGRYGQEYDIFIVAGTEPVFAPGGGLGIVDGEGILFELANTSLKDVAAGQLTRFQLWSALVDSSKGLAHMHRKRFMHRDIKPANVLVFYDRDTGMMTAKLADFGVSKLAEATGTFREVGSPYYQAGEVVGVRQLTQQGHRCHQSTRIRSICSASV